MFFLKPSFYKIYIYIYIYIPTPGNIENEEVTNNFTALTKILIHFVLFTASLFFSYDIFM